MSPSLASFDDNSSSVSIEDLSIAQKKDNVLHNLINALKVLKSKGVSEYNEQYQSLLQLIQLYSSNKISIKGTDIAYSIGNGVVESETVTAASAAAAVAAAQPKVVSTISEVVEEDIDMNDTQTTSTTSTTTSTSGGDVDMMTNEDDEEQTTTNKLDEELRLKANQIPIFKAQLEAFKYLSRNLPIPSNTLSKISNLLEYEPKEEFDDLKFYSKGSIKTDNLNQPNPDIPETYKGLYEAVQSIHEREERIASKIQYRIEELKDLPSTIQPELKTRSLIEMKQLKVLNVQKKVRNDILSELNEDIFINSVDNIDIFVKPIPRETFKSGEMMYEGSTSQQNVESIFTVNRKKFLSAVLNHHKEFSEFHSKKEKQTKNALKLIHRFHLEKERREQERLRKERIRLLKLQDTEGYRDLLAKTKNDRLEMLMSQTDSLLSKIDFLVQKEKVEQEERAEKEREEREEKEKLDLIANANTPPSSNNQVDGSSTEEKKDGVATEGGDKTVNGDGQKEGDSSTTSTTTTTTTTTLHKRSSLYNEVIVREQPKCMTGGKLKEYQITGLQWMVNLYNNKLNGILADEMGLGKTVQTIALVCYLFEKKVLEPFLIVAPLSTISNWESEFHRWAPRIPVVIYRGKPDERRNLARKIPRDSFGVLITSFEYILSDHIILGRIPWCYIIVDEGHRIKNKSSKLSVQLRKYHSKHRLLLTGTPLQNDLGELWSLLNFLLPTIFNSLDTFEQWFNAPFTGGSSAKQPKSHISVNEEESLIIINRLHQVLRYFLLRRLKKDVESQLPEKKERVIKCNLSAMQIVMYRSIAEYGQLPIDPTSEMFKKSKTGMRGFNNTLKQMQKICNHPYLFLSEWDINEDLIRASGKFDMMDQILLKMKASGHRVLIFTQMTEVINLMGEYFSLKEWDYLRLDGSTKPEERSRLVVEWNRKDSPFFIFVLSTHAGGLGMNLQTADTVIIFDSDWNPQMDLQAQDRCHRVGQVNRVNVFRLISANSIEEKILERATDKLEIDAKIIQAGMFNTHSNDQERRAKLEEFLHGFPANTAEEATTDLEEINRLIARDDEELIQFQAIDKEAARIETLKNKGVKKQHKSRLIIESELPEWLMRSPVAEDKEPLGARKRTTLNNLPMDDLTEIQWERMMELGMSLPEFKEYLANKKKKRVDLKKGSSAKKSTPKRKRKDSESDSEEEDDGYYSDSLLMSDSEDITVTPTNDQEMDQDGEEKEKEKTSTTSTATTPAHTPGKRGRPPKRASSAAITSPPEKKKPAAVTKRQRNAGAADTTTTEDEEETNGVASDVSVSNDDQPMSPTQSSRRKRLSFTPKTLASPVAAASDDATPENGTPYKPRRASTRGSASVKKESQQQQPNGDAHDATNNNNTTESSSSAEKPNDEIFQGIIEKIKRIKEKTRKVSELFWDLPSRSDYPDYFKVIKNPISMNEISQGSYKTPELFVSDWKLMFNNALTYNDPDSQVYRDAITLYDILATEVKSHFESVIIPPLSKV